MASLMGAYYQDRLSRIDTTKDISEYLYEVSRQKIENDFLSQREVKNQDDLIKQLAENQATYLLDLLMLEMTMISDVLKVVLLALAKQKLD